MSFCRLYRRPPEEKGGVQYVWFNHLLRVTWVKLWLKISSSWGTFTIRFIHILWKDSICLVYWPRAHGNDVRTVMHLNMVKDNLHKNMTREKHTDRVWCSELCRICGECQRLNIIHNSSSCGVYFFRTFCICVGRYMFLCFITFEKECFTCFLEELCLKVPLTTKMFISLFLEEKFSY